jgi:hypothetical protein
MMWRFLAFLFCLSLSPFSMADGSSKPVIEHFSQDAVPLLGVGEDSVPVRFYWRANVKKCQILMDQQSIDVSRVTTATINIPETMDVRLRCGTAEAVTHIPVRKKLSIVSLTVAASPTGKKIVWEAYGAVNCRIREEARQLDVREQPAKGQYFVKEDLGRLSIQLSCEDAQGRLASARFSEFHRGNREPNLLAKAAEPEKK